jgi:hypothetical protein
MMIVMKEERRTSKKIGDQARSSRNMKGEESKYPVKMSPKGIRTEELNQYADTLPLLN